MRANIRTSSIVVFHDPGYPHIYSEATLAQLIPAEFQITDAAGLATALERGTLLVSGVISRSPHNLPFDPMLTNMQQEELQPRTVSRYEELEIAPGETQHLVFGGEKIGYVRKAHNQLKTYRYGEGTVVWSGLPLELSSNLQATHHVYRQVLDLRQQRNWVNSPLLVARQPLKDGTLVLVISELGSPQRIMLDEGIQIEVAPNRAGAVMLKSRQVMYIFGGVRSIADDE